MMRVSGIRGCVLKGMVNVRVTRGHVTRDLAGKATDGPAALHPPPQDIAAGTSAYIRTGDIHGGAQSHEARNVESSPMRV